MMENYGCDYDVQTSVPPSFNITNSIQDQQENFQFQQHISQYQSPNSEEVFYKQQVVDFNNNNNNHDYQENHLLQLNQHQQYDTQAFSTVPSQPHQQDSYQSSSAIINQYQSTAQGNSYSYNDDEVSHNTCMNQQSSVYTNNQPLFSPTNDAEYFPNSSTSYQHQELSQKLHQPNNINDLQANQYHQSPNQKSAHQTQSYYQKQIQPFTSHQIQSVADEVTGGYASIESSNSHQFVAKHITYTDTELSTEETYSNPQNTTLPATKKTGRPRKRNTRSKNDKVNGKLWEFIRDLLLSDRTNPSFIRWERREDGVFKFVQSDKVAKMWGERKQNPKMTYEKLSRAMRYYYKSKVLLPVFGRRLVYKFGPNATGWMPDVLVQNFP